MRYALSSIALALASSGCFAQSPAIPYPSIDPVHSAQGCASLEVVSARRTLPRIGFNGQTWLEGRPGAEYTLIARNSCPFRVLAVLSVDGLDVLSGDGASFKSRGYVLEPGSEALVDGWRKSNNQVAAFFFSSPSASYAERVGKGGNVGVIGAAFFQEIPAPAPMPYPPADRQRMEPLSESAKGMAAPAPSMRSMPAPAPRAPASADANNTREMRSLNLHQEPSLGTGHGRRIESSVTSTTFYRMPTPFATISLRYESTQKLQDMGAIARPATGPNPFPAQPDPTYVPDPPPYRRY